MNASVRSGKPTIIVPCVFDQFMHAERVNQLGIGIWGIAGKMFMLQRNTTETPNKKIPFLWFVYGVGMKHISKETPTSIAAAITKCVESETIRAKAEEVGAAFRQEEQEAKPKLVQFVHDYFRDYVDGGLYKDMVRELREKRERKCCFSCCSKKA
ncbi:inlA [Symbiodinium pilosum]|uniref:InlA protein n=1 Tax=Symbiodinium pilosum TaxID=2952 RepID=A0A812KLZ4_SYMPI|nr:inlA [Symbiodinium pilosum]